MLKCLTVKQPWAAAIASGAKRIENRDWHTHYRGKLLIHAGASFDVEAIHDPGFARWIATNRTSDARSVRAIVAIVDLVDCVRIEELHTTALGQQQMSDWARGPWCWILANAVDVRVPHEKGALALWTWPHTTQLSSIQQRLIPNLVVPQTVEQLADCCTDSVAALTEALQSLARSRLASTSGVHDHFRPRNQSTCDAWRLTDRGLIVLADLQQRVAEARSRRQRQTAQ